MVLQMTRFSCANSVYSPKSGIVIKLVLSLVLFILVGYLIYQISSSSRYASILTEILANNDEENDALCKKQFGLEKFYNAKEKACDYCKEFCDGETGTKSTDTDFCFSKCKEYLILKETQSRIAKLRDEIIKEIRGMNPLKEVSKEDDHLNKIIVELQLKIDKAIDETENVWKEVELMGKNSIVEMKNLRSEIENVKKKENLQWKMTQDAVISFQGAKILFYFVVVYFFIFISMILIYLFCDNCFPKIFGKRPLKKVRQM